MKMRRLLVNTLGILTVLPVIGLIGIGICLATGHVFPILFGTEENGHVGIAIIALVLSWFVLIIIYILHSYSNASLSKSEKDKWRILFSVIPYIAMLKYWYKFMYENGRKE
ncbi:hypothetical protein [Mesoterricola silvestris]|uniref:hypothetical protein n=1 Tax=Mesoterricola silvestris TaxID=2927979 RepID=UPI00292F0C39|nr:hypothetical protein [Mesoterricola silvestris]